MNDLNRNELLDLFGLDENATPQTLKKRYRDLATQYHPDSNRKGATPDKDHFALITSAYDQLGKLLTQSPASLSPLPEIDGWISAEARECYTGQVITVSWAFEGATKITFLNTGKTLPQAGKTRFQIPYHAQPALKLSIMAENAGERLPALAEVELVITPVGSYILNQLKPVALYLGRFAIGWVMAYLVYRALLA